MSDDLVIALLFGVGGSGWIFSKVSRRQGEGNYKTTILVTAISLVFITTVVYISLRTYIKN